MGASYTGPTTISPGQLRHWRACRNIARQLDIPASTLAHRQLKGTTTVTPQGNTILTGAGPLNDPTDFSAQFQQTWPVWWVQQMFIRGEQRQDDFEFGVTTVQFLQSQIPAVDVTGQELVVVEEDDFIIDAWYQNYWRVINPVLAPDGSHWAFIAERQR